MNMEEYNKHVAVTAASLLNVENAESRVNDILGNLNSIVAPSAPTLKETIAKQVVEKLWTVDKITLLYPSPLQKGIFKGVLHNNNEATVGEIASYLVSKKIAVKSNYVIGGSLGGVSKKAKRVGEKGIWIYNKLWNSKKESYVYSFEESARDAIEEYLKK